MIVEFESQESCELRYAPSTQFMLHLVPIRRRWRNMAQWLVRGRERLELSKALLRASDKAANPRSAAKAKAAPKAAAGNPSKPGASSKTGATK